MLSTGAAIPQQKHGATIKSTGPKLPEPSNFHSTIWICVCEIPSYAKSLLKTNQTNKNPTRHVLRPCPVFLPAYNLSWGLSLYLLSTYYVKELC